MISENKSREPTPGILVVSVILGVWTSCFCIARAQNQPGGLEIAEVEGTLQAIAGSRLKVLGDDNSEYFVMLTGKSTFKYAGTAEAKFLRPGLMVRFTATFDVQKGIAIKPVGEIEIFRPAKQRRMTQEQRQSQTPGIYPREEKGRENRKGKSQANETGALEVGNVANQLFLVVGRLAAIQAGKIRVQAGTRAMVVDLEPDSKITVAAGDGAFCLPGDKVKVTGLRNAAQSNLIKAEAVEIKGSQPLGLDGAVQNAGDSPKGKRDGLRERKSQ